MGAPKGDVVQQTDRNRFSDLFNNAIGFKDARRPDEARRVGLTILNEMVQRGLLDPKYSTPAQDAKPVPISGAGSAKVGSVLLHDEGSYSKGLDGFVFLGDNLDTTRAKITAWAVTQIDEARAGDDSIPDLNEMSIADKDSYIESWLGDQFNTHDVEVKDTAPTE